MYSFLFSCMFVYFLIDNYKKGISQENTTRENIELREKIHKAELELAIVKYTKNTHIYPIMEPSAPEFNYFHLTNI